METYVMRFLAKGEAGSSVRKLTRYNRKQSGVPALSWPGAGAGVGDGARLEVQTLGRSQGCNRLLALLWKTSQLIPVAGDFLRATAESPATWGDLSDLGTLRRSGCGTA